MPERETIRRTLLDFLQAETGETVGGLEDEKKLRQELGLDSVDVVSIVMQIERHYRIRLAHEELESLVTVGELIDLIHAKIRSAGTAEAAAA
jgi:acyl carrier protein